MVEFGEQLKRAREAKGITQQSLAERLFVTRQTVSRWECGNRYPNLFTVRKIAELLDVSIDTLLSREEMKKAVEKREVFEQPVMRNAVLILYASISFSYFAIIVDMMVKFHASPMSVIYHNNMIELYSCIIVLALQVFIYGYGLALSIRGSLMPKSVGVIIVIHMVDIYVINLMLNLFLFNDGEFPILNIIFSMVFMLSPFLVGAIGAYQYFCRTSNSKIQKWFVYVACGWGIFTTLSSLFNYVNHYTENSSMYITISLLLGLSTYVLFVLQTVIVAKKRQQA